MGYRAHIVTKITREHNGSSTFNRNTEEVLEMLEKNGIDVHTKWHDIDSASWEISTLGDSGKMYQRYIAKLETLPQNETNEFFTERSEYTNQDIKETLEEWWDHRDQRDDVIRVDWF